MKTIKLLNSVWMAAALTCALTLATGLSSPAAAQAQNPGAPAKVAGVVKDEQGTLAANLTISFKNLTSGLSVDSTTDRFGLFSHAALAPGKYTITIKQGQNVWYMEDIEFMPGEDKKLDLDFRELKAKEAAEAAAAAKENAEYRAAFAAMKVHFDAAVAALETAKQKRAEVDKLPKDQQAAAEGQIMQPASTAVTEFNAALQGTKEDDPNRGILYSRLGEAYELTGKCPDAVGAYQKAVALKPDPSSYNNLGNCLAKMGKVDDSEAAYQKAIELDPANTAMYWRNLSVGLYNSGRIKESVEPLKKATAADPKNAQAWYLLGAALVNTMEFKQDGDKLIPIITPGTIEAYQKAIDLDPNGPFGVQAKQGIDTLQAMGVGIDTKIGSAPAPKNTKTPPKR